MISKTINKGSLLANQIKWPKGCNKVFIITQSDMTLIFWPQECKTFRQCFIPRAGIMAPFAKYLGQRHSRGDSLPVEANLSIKEFQTP